jgi:hypothetical protein
MKWKLVTALLCICIGIVSCTKPAQQSSAKLVQNKTLAPEQPQPSTVQGAPTSYTVARTDQAITQVPAPMPKWGSTGIGQKWCNPAFNGICMIRLTDRTSWPNAASGLSVEAGKENPFSKDSKFVMVSNSNGASKIIAFDPKKELPKATATVFKNGPAEFSYNEANSAFQRQNKTQVAKLTSTNSWLTYSSTLVYDFAKCLPTGYVVTWVSSWSISSSDTEFTSIYSNNGGQGSGGLVVYWKKSKGCASLNTLTGVVTDWNGKVLGTIDDGSKPLADRFVVHDGGSVKMPGVVSLGYSVNDNTKGAKGTSGCKAGDCAGNDPYFWEVYDSSGKVTTHLRPCGPYQCGGHSASAYQHAAGKKLELHNLLNPSTPLTKLITLPCCGYDMQGSWNNADSTSAQPIAIVTSLVTKVPGPPFNGPYQNEITMVQPVANGKAWREGQTLNTGMSPYYICQTAHQSISPDGHWVLFSTDAGGNGALGYEVGSAISACDAFLMELK